MQSKLGTLEKPKKETIRLCKQCSKMKRYANLTLCYGCWRTQEREKRAKKKEVRLIRKAKSKEKKANSPAVLKDTLDSLTSLYVRLRASDWQGNATCITCGKVAHYKTLQAGHYVSRSNYSVRYDLRNIHVQCFKCNMKFGGCKGGNLVQYTKYLLNTYGEKWLKELIADGEKIKQWTPEELKNLIADFKNKLASL